MLSRDLVKKTLEFSSPPRVPRDIWLLPWARENYPQEVEKLLSDFPNDIVHSPGFLRESPHITGDPYSPGYYIDEWGCKFENKQSGIIGEVKEPLIKDWKDLEELCPPRECLTVDVDRVNQFCRETDKFVLAGACPRPFERLQFLRRTENLYIDLIEQPREFWKLVDIVHGFYMEEMRIWAETEVDALMFMDDWGAQRSLLISPELWRKVFKPLYREYIELAHKHDKYIFMHSDGYILDIIPDLIDLGLDALNSQIFCMGLDQLKQFRGKLTFWGEIDRQHLLPYGTKDDIRSAVRKVKEALYCDGGVIAQCEFGIGAKPENVYTVFATWDEVG